LIISQRRLLTSTKEVVKRLRAKIATVMTDSSTSQEEIEGLVKEKGIKKAATILGDVLMRLQSTGVRMTAGWCARTASYLDSTGGIVLSRGSRGGKVTYYSLSN
jgi:hypothetical protein